MRSPFGSAELIGFIQSLTVRLERIMQVLAIQLSVLRFVSGLKGVSLSDLVLSTNEEGTYLLLTKGKPNAILSDPGTGSQNHGS